MVNLLSSREVQQATLVIKVMIVTRAVVDFGD
nr:hypothetical protein [Tanacetum cinerariifolium]